MQDYSDGQPPYADDPHVLIEDLQSQVDSLQRQLEDALNQISCVQSQVDQLDKDSRYYTERVVEDLRRDMYYQLDRR